MANRQKASKGIVYYARAIHRVLGYLAFGLTLVYALSGITLIFRTTDFLKESKPVSAELAPGLSADALGAELPLRRLNVEAETATEIRFAEGTYNKQTGHVDYVKKEWISPINRFAELHLVPVAKNKAVAIGGTVYGIILILLALTSLFMYKPSAGQFKRGIVYTLLGVIAALVLILLL